MCSSNATSSLTKLLKCLQKLDKKNFHDVMDTTRSAFAEAVSKIDTQIDQEARHKYVYDIQRENVDLQLEAR